MHADARPRAVGRSPAQGRWRVPWLVWMIVVMIVGCRGASIRPRMIAARPAVAHVSAGVHGIGAAVATAAHHAGTEYEVLQARVEGRGAGTPTELLRLAELAWEIGRRERLHSDAESMVWFRDAAVYAIFSLGAPGEPDGAPVRQAACRVHHRAVVELLRAAGASEKSGDPSGREAMAAAGVEVVAPRGDSVDELWPTEDYRVDRMEPRVEGDGLGVPVIVGHLFPDRSATPDRFYPRNMRLPATAVMTPGGDLAGGAWRGSIVSLTLHDPQREPAIVVGMSRYPLAYDLTTPLAHQLLKSPLKQYSLEGVVRPGRLEEWTGIYMSEPYRPGAIPVVFIHGLSSSPMTWLVAMNSLRADPVIRQRYQFWVAFYPTGAGVLKSMVKLRDDLRDIRQWFDASGSDASIDQMVLVGHSLGGVSAKILSESSGRAVEAAVFRVPLEQVRMSDETRAGVEKLLRFEPVPSVRRIVMLAAPHRGSRRANQLIGRVTDALTRPAQPTQDLLDEIRAMNSPEVFMPEYRRRSFSTVDNLEPTSPVLLALADLPISPLVAHHSIIGVLNPELPPSMHGDLVVPYDSAHVGTAESELIVRRTHFCTGAPEVVAEFRRILRLHIGLGDEVAW